MSAETAGDGDVVTEPLKAMAETGRFCEGLPVPEGIIIDSGDDDLDEVPLNATYYRIRSSRAASMVALLPLCLHPCPGDVQVVLTTVDRRRWHHQ